MANCVETHLDIFDGMANGYHPVTPPDLYPIYEKKIVNKDIYLCLYPKGGGTLIYNSMTDSGSVRVAELTNLRNIPKPCTFFYLPIESISFILNTISSKGRSPLKKQNNNTYYYQASIIKASSFIHKMCKLNNIKYSSTSFKDNPLWDTLCSQGYYSSTTVFELGFSESFIIDNFTF